MRQFSTGFTLIELMIVVAIIGILSSLAIPEYQAFVLRSKRAEVPMMVSAIRTTQWSYMAEWGQFTSAPLTPPTSSGRTPVHFGIAAGTASPWNQLGFLPDSDVYGQYRATASGFGSTGAFVIDGYADIDGDALLCHYMADNELTVAMQSMNNIY